jgi:hypothetical protein
MLTYDADRLEAGVRSILANHLSIFLDEPNHIRWRYSREGDTFSKEGSLADVAVAFAELRRGTQWWWLSLLPLKKTPNMGLVLAPSEWVTVTINEVEKRFKFEAQVAGQRRANEGLAKVGDAVTLIQVVLPDHYQRIEPSLRRLLTKYPDVDRNVFIMARFGDAPVNQELMDSIRGACKARGLNPLRADDAQYASGLLDNVLTYLYGCGSAVAVFEEINYREYNPNVALEVGFTLAQGKPLLLLKDKAMKSLPTDIIGEIYRDFDSYRIAETVPGAVERWLRDHDLGDAPSA